MDIRELPDFGEAREERMFKSREESSIFLDSSRASDSDSSEDGESNWDDSNNPLRLLYLMSL